VQKAAFGAVHAADFEHVAKVGAELERKWDQHHVTAVVYAPDALIEPLFPEEALALDVQNAGRTHRTAGIGQGLVGAVGGEEHVVLSDGRRQERRWPASQQQAEVRQNTRVVVEKTVTLAKDVAEGVGDHEGVLVLQRKQPMGDPRLARFTQVDRRVGGRREIVHQPLPSGVRDQRDAPFRAGRSKAGIEV
jgi:hypothetical protein